MTTKRRRQDGTWTYATEEWDAKWYWTVGERVNVAVREGGREPGRVTKVNATTVWVTFDSGRAAAKVPMAMLTRGDFHNNGWGR